MVAPGVGAGARQDYRRGPSSPLGQGSSPSWRVLDAPVDLVTAVFDKMPAGYLV